MSHPTLSFVQVHKLFEAKVRRRLRFDRAMMDLTLMSLCHCCTYVVMNLVACVQLTNYVSIMYHMT